MRSLNTFIPISEPVSKYGVFTKVHIPLLVFQANTLWHVRNKYRITKADFVVLAAGHMLQEDSLMKHFDSSGITKVVLGVGHNLIYKSLLKLLKLGLIALKSPKKNQRKYVMTEKGVACIQSYVQYFNYSIGLYRGKLNNIGRTAQIDHLQPD